MPRPRSLSVVVITVESADRLRGCLTALCAQEASEVLVPWDGTHGEPGALAREFPTVRFLPEAPSGLTFAQLRARGIARATGDVIALTEDHFIPAPDWCRRILEAHRAPPGAIGGAVEKQTPDTPLDWALYFADYLRYLDPPEGPAPSLTDGNVSYKRDALDAVRSTWETEFHEDVVHAALRERGRVLWLSPRIIVRQKRVMTLGAAVRDRYAFGRLFGSTRSARRSAAGRVRLALLCAAVPPLLLARIAGHVARTHRYVASALRAFPALLLLSTVWALGEFLGYVTGRPAGSLAANTAMPPRGRSAPASP